MHMLQGLQLESLQLSFALPLNIFTNINLECSSILLFLLLTFEIHICSACTVYFLAL